MGRPKKPIDRDQVMKLAAMGCRQTEIAAFFDVSDKTISSRFSKELRKGVEMGKTKLRRLMWQSCEKGNVTMQIWLSKNILGYTDKLEQVADPEAKPMRLIIEREKPKGE